MKLRTGIAVIGALLGAGGASGAFLGLGMVWAALGIVAGIVLVGYVVAAVTALPAHQTTIAGELTRGLLVGLNAAANGFVAAALLEAAGAPVAGVVTGAVLGALNLLAVIGPVSCSEVFQGAIGWLTWIFPMSWLVVGLGLAFLLISLLLHGVTVGRVPYLRIQNAGTDWKTGTFFFKGGLIANLNYRDTAFNMGNFSFVDYKSGGWHKDHEAGHTLNLTAFGSIFHLVGAVDENVLPARGARAFAERIAESNDTGRSGMNIPMWA